MREESIDALNAGLYPDTQLFRNDGVLLVVADDEDDVEFRSDIDDPGFVNDYRVIL